MGCVRKACILLVLGILAGCGGMMDDLNPSDSDKQSVEQQAPDFTILDTQGQDVNLYSELTGTGVKGVVLYFTMWCDQCKVDLDKLNAWIIPQHRDDVVFFAVDYISGSVDDALNAQTKQGFLGAKFGVLADIGGNVAASYDGTMGITVVIDRNGIIRLNETFKDGARVDAALSSLP